MPGHSVRDLPRAPPARPRARREAQHDAHARFVVALGADREWLARAPIHRAHLARERARGQALRNLEPRPLVLGCCNAAQESRLRPRDLAGDECRVDVGQPAQLAIDVREILHLARGETEPLACIVAQPHIAEPIPRARGDQPPGQRREHPTQRRARSRQLGEASLDAGRFERPDHRECFHTNLDGTERVIAGDDRWRV